MNEATFKAKICSQLRSANALVFNHTKHRSNYSDHIPGVPDIYLCHSYWKGFIEFKGAKTVVKKHQKKMISEIKKRGDNAVVIRYPDRIEDEEGNLLGTFPNGVVLPKILRSLT